MTDLTKRTSEELLAELDELSAARSADDSVAGQFRAAGKPDVAALLEELERKSRANAHSVSKQIEELLAIAGDPSNPACIAARETLEGRDEAVKRALAQIRGDE